MSPTRRPTEVEANEGTRLVHSVLLALCSVCHFQLSITALILVAIKIPIRIWKTYPDTQSGRRTCKYWPATVSTPWVAVRGHPVKYCEQSLGKSYLNIKWPMHMHIANSSIMVDKWRKLYYRWSNRIRMISFAYLRCYVITAKLIIHLIIKHL